MNTASVAYLGKKLKIELKLITVMLHTTFTFNLIIAHIILYCRD